VEHKLLRDVGLTIHSNDIRPGSPWAFCRTGKYKMFEAQAQRLFEEINPRDADKASTKSRAAHRAAGDVVTHCRTPRASCPLSIGTV